jgi:hypothetical protein
VASRLRPPAAASTAGMAAAMAAGMAAAFVVAVTAALLGIGVRATHGGHAAVDEPQYLLSALSLAEDGDLDIADELAAQRWRAFSDAELPTQTALLDGGRQISPHDPLLPLLLALPMRLGGFVAAKATLALVGGATAALVVWVAVRRFAVPSGLATAGVALAFASPPLAVYGQQVYPEVPAALAVTAGIAAVTGRLSPGGVTTLGAAVVALPWLGAKYAPVAAMLAVACLVALLRARRGRSAVALAGVLAAAGLLYLGVHRLVWGGWTVYASGDHFLRSGEFSVVGVAPDYAGRSLRLVGLLADRGYGLAAWQPGWLLVVPALAALLAARPRHWVTLALPLAAGWLVATFAALTMHGFWWPGRQVVVVLPLALLTILWWLARTSPWLRRAAAALGAAGVVALAALLTDGWAGKITWVSGFERVDDPLYQAVRPLLPDYRSAGAGLWLRHVLWIAVLLALAVAGWRSAAPARRVILRRRPVAEQPPGLMIDAGAGVDPTQPQHMRAPASTGPPHVDRRKDTR